VDGSRQHAIAVVDREVSCQARNRADVEPAVGDHLQEHRVVAGGPRCGDPHVGLGLGQMEHPGAVGEHGRAGLAQVETPRVHLADVREELRFGPPTTVQELGEAGQQCVVRDRRK
jgi:hypothetical protein